MNCTASFLAVCLLICSVANASPDPADKPAGTDTVVFTNGDKLTGKLERSADDCIVFKSNVAGEVTIQLSKVKELHTAGEYAVVPKNVGTRRASQLVKVPVGELSSNNGDIQVRGPEQKTIGNVPMANVGYIIDQKTFDAAFINPPGLEHGWTGAASLGVSLVESTQKSNSLSGALELVRTIPEVSWLDPRNRTTLSANFAYGTTTQPNTPEIKTDLYHVGLERDQYISSRAYVFGSAGFDHNFSQGLDLQQNYGVGFGWTALKTASSTFDVKGSGNYIRREFATSSFNENIFGSTFGELFMHKFTKGILLNEGLTIVPAWTNPDDYSAVGTLGLTVPVYKKFGLSLAVVDDYLNNPPPGFRQNSVQFTTGLTYAIH